MRKRFNLKKEFGDSVDFIKQSKQFIYFVMLIFLLFSIVGFFIPLPEYLSNQLIEYFQSLVLQTEGFNSVEMVLFLFQNNAFTSLMGILLGVFVGIFSFINAILNGFVLGFASKVAVMEEGFFVLWRLFPHGIFELPALFISLGLGLRLSTFILEKNKLKVFRELLEKSIKAYVLIILPLLFIAAIIEGILIVFAS